MPPVRIYDKGVLNKGVLDIMLNNSRTPDMNRADLMALIAGCRTASTRVRELCDRFGRDTYMAACDLLLARTREAMKVVIAQIHPGRAGDLHRLCRRRRPRQRSVQDDADDLPARRDRGVRLDRHRRSGGGADQLPYPRRALQAVLRRLHDHGVRPLGALQRGVLRPLRDRAAGRQPAQSALPRGALEPPQYPHPLLRLPVRRARPDACRICRWRPATAPARISSSRAPTRTANTSS